MKVLVFNCGSSSIKYQLFDMPSAAVLARGSVQRIGEDGSSAVQESGEKKISITQNVRDHDESLELIVRMLTDPRSGAVRSLGEIDACGHRVVHGGEAVSGSVRIDDSIEKIIEDHFDLAPLHNPPNLIGIRASRRALGETPQVACFDTAFHQTIPPVAHLYALPYDMYEKHRVRRYGFHGTSHRFVARRAAQLLGKHTHDVNLITCHLGNGCSVTAVQAGLSVDTSMGLTPLEGLVMGTRTGDLDPAIVFYLVRKGYDAAQLDGIFNKKSGLLGISGSSNDMRDLEQKASAGDTRARLALDMFAYRLRKYIGAYMAALGRCDAIVFTGGIGENSPQIRSQVLDNLEALGIALDPALNGEMIRRREGPIHAHDSRVSVLVVPTDEEKAIADDTYAIVSGQK